MSWFPWQQCKYVFFLNFPQGGKFSFIRKHLCNCLLGCKTARPGFYCVEQRLSKRLNHLIHLIVKKTTCLSGDIPPSLARGHGRYPTRQKVTIISNLIGVIVTQQLILR